MIGPNELLEVLLGQLGAFSAADELFVAILIIGFATIVSYAVSRSLMVGAVVLVGMISFCIWLGFLPMWVIMLLCVMVAVMIISVFAGRKEGA